MKRYRRLRAATKRAAMFISFLAMTAPAFGEVVYGKVYLDGQPFNGTLRLSDGSEVTIRNGDYRLYVPAGDYPVTFESEHNGPQFKVIIHSSTDPLNKDIYWPPPQ